MYMGQHFEIHSFSLPTSGIGEFITRISKLEEDLEFLLNAEFDRESNDELESGFGEIFHGILVNRDTRAAQRMEYLKENLQVIKENKPSILSQYQEDFEQGTDDQYHGVRTEIGITSSLIKKGVNLTVRESPDYEIEFEGDTIFGEATSKHITQSKDRDLTYQILRSIRSKCDKDYSNPDTLLFLDVTNINWHMMAHGREFDTPKLRQAITDEMEDGDFGAVLLMSHYGVEGKFGRAYLRVDNDPSDTVLRFLEEYYEKGDFEHDEINQPPAG